MQGTSNWILGGVFGLLAILSLFIASHGHGDTQETYGLVLFIACVLGVFWVINKAYSDKK